MDYISTVKILYTAVYPEIFNLAIIGKITKFNDGQFSRYICNRLSMNSELLLLLCMCFNSGYYNYCACSVG